MSSKELKKQSPTLGRLLKMRLAPIRETALLAAATSVEKPVKPAAGDCCGSSCKPCVMDLYREELMVWKECSASRTIEIEESDASIDSNSETEKKLRVPGAFEW